MIDEKLLEKWIAKEINDLVRKRIDKIVEAKVSAVLDEELETLVEDAVSNSIDYASIADEVKSGIDFDELEGRIEKCEEALEAIRQC